MKRNSNILQIVVMAVAGGVSSYAGIVMQTNFQAPGTSLGVYTTGATLGTPNAITVDFGEVGVVNTPCTMAGGTGQCLQFRPEAGPIPMIASSNQFGPGSYQVLFEMAGGSVNSTVLAQMGTNPQLFTVVANTGFNTYQFLTTVPNGVSSHLSLQGSGFLLNSITVTDLATGTATPEPSTAAMLIGGAGLMGLGVRKRFRNSGK